MAVTISRTAWTDDDGSGATGTMINNAVKTELYNQIDAALALCLPLAGGTLTGAVTVPGLITVNGAGGGFNLPSRDGSGTTFVLYNPTGDDWRIFNGAADVIVLTAAGVLSLPVYTAASWVSGDCYLVVNASGVVHRSAVGPAS